MTTNKPAAETVTTLACDLSETGTIWHQLDVAARLAGYSSGRDAGNVLGWNQPVGKLLGMLADDASRLD